MIEIKIYIDPGHGGNSIGALYNGRKEQDDVLRLALSLRNILKGKAEVKLSRETDVNPVLNDRCVEANEWGADYYISLHRNSCAKANTATGAEVWVYSKAAANGSTFNKAKRILELVCQATGYVNRGTKQGAPSYADFAVNRVTNMNSCLIELGFQNNEMDNAVFDSRFNEMVQAIAKGLLEAVGTVDNTPAVDWEAKYKKLVEDIKGLF